jgi:hypothetical protein
LPRRAHVKAPNAGEVSNHAPLQDRAAEELAKKCRPAVSAAD